MRQSIYCRFVNAVEPAPTHLNIDILWSRDLNFVELPTKAVERPVRFFIVRRCEFEIKKTCSSGSESPIK